VRSSLLYKGLTQTVLDNGMRVLVEKVPRSRSISVGLWVSAGSRDDIASQSGIAHFVEHMVFKGTKTRTSSQISNQIDSIGGQINGGTGKEYTFYYAQAPLAGLSEVLEIISDMVQHPRLSEHDLELERGVVLEELCARTQDPQQQAHDMFIAGLWQHDHPLNRCILGRSDTVEEICCAHLASFHSRFYRPKNMSLVVCGGACNEEVVSLASVLFTQTDPGLNSACHVPPQLISGHTYYSKEISQSHIYIGFPAPEASSDDRFCAELVNIMLGGGTSSRLFKHVREDLGLAYSVSSSLVSYSDSGVWVTYAGIAPQNAKRTLSVLIEEMEALHRGVSEDELSLARAKLRGNFILDLELNINRMARLGSSAVLANDILSPDQVIAKIDSVTLDDIHRIISCYLDVSLANVVVVGPEGMTLQPKIAVN